MKKKLWLVLFIIGLIPFVVLLCGGIYAAIFGFSGILISYQYHGIQAFMDWVILWSFLYWPSYIIGIVLIIVALIIKKKDI